MLVLDTGPIVAAAATRDRHHRDCAALLTRSTPPLGIVDASIVALCERLGETKLATLDRRHLGAIRPRHCDAFELLPS